MSDFLLQGLCCCASRVDRSTQQGTQGRRYPCTCFAVYSPVEKEADIHADSLSVLRAAAASFVNLPSFHYQQDH